MKYIYIYIHILLLFFFIYIYRFNLGAKWVSSGATRFKVLACLLEYGVPIKAAIKH